MKLSLIVLATGALAATLDHRSPLLLPRQDAVVGDIKSIENAIKAAGSAVDSGDYKKLASDFSTLLDELDKATSAAKSLPMLQQEQALTLAEPAQSLSKTTVEVLKKVSSKKPDIVKAGLGGAVYAGLQQAQSKAAAFIKALTAKIPTSLSTVAAGIVQPTVAQLDKTVTDFKDAGSSSGGSAPSAPSSVAAAAPAASTPMPMDTTPPTSDTSAPTKPDAAASSPPSTPAVYGPVSSTNTTTANSTTPTSSAPPMAYTGAAAAVFAMGPAALAAAAIVAVAAF